MIPPLSGSSIDKIVPDEGVPELEPPKAAEHAAQAAQMLFDGAARAAQFTANLPIFRPTFDRKVPNRLATDLIKARLVPLLAEVAQRKVELRTKRAEGLPDQFDEILKDAQAIVAHTGDPEKLFGAVSKLSVKLERALNDVDYATFGQLGLFTQLRAVAITLRTSRALWASVRTGYAMRDGQHRRHALQLLSLSESVVGKATRGIDVSDDLAKLEQDYSGLVERLQSATGDELGLPGASNIRAAAKAWHYRQRVEAEILERSPHLEGPLSHPVFVQDLRDNGPPTEVLRQDFQNVVVPAIRKILADVGAARGDLPDRIRERGDALVRRAEKLLLSPPDSIDGLEAEIVANQEELSLLLADVEALVKPADGAVRRLRQANEALLGLRALFVSLRVMSALEDPELGQRFKSISEDAERLMIGDLELDEIPAAIQALDSRIDSLDADLKARLHVDGLPAIAELRASLGALRRLVRMRLATRAASNPQIRAALAAAQNPALTAEERGPIFDEAMGPPLLDATVGVMVAFRELDPGFTAADIGRAIDAALNPKRDNALSDLVVKSPLGFLASANFERGLAHFDEFFETIDTEEGAAFVDQSLNVARAIYEVERDHLANFSAVVPENERLKVATALSEYALRSSMILTEWAGEQLADPSGMALADFLELMIDHSAHHLEHIRAQIDPAEFGTDDIAAARARLAHDAADEALRLGSNRLGRFGNELSAGPGGPFADRLRNERAKLEEALSVVEAGPESRAAVQHVITDLGAAVKMGLNMVQLFGAASNARMDDGERERVIQHSVERMGPMFIKIMQTLVNMEEVVRRASPDTITKDQDPVIRSLKKLQDEVTPLPWASVVEQLRSGLDMGDDEPLEDVGDVQGRYVSIEKQAFKSGSIGQLHRAKIRVDRDGKEVIEDVVVKILRPDVDEAFENTVRTTRLMLSLVKELLRLDANGDIFGEIKQYAESRLPQIENALNGFIDVFRIETDFIQEVENLQAFEKMFRADPHVIVPEVHGSHTSKTVLTMQELKGFKLSKWTDRLRTSRDATRLAESLGRVRGKDKDAECRRRALLWAEQTLGLEDGTAHTQRSLRRGKHIIVKGTNSDGEQVEEVLRIRTRSGRIKVSGESGGPSQSAARGKAELAAVRAFGLKVKNVTSVRDEQGVHCRVEFDDRVQESARFFVDGKTGAVEPRSPVPDLSGKGAERLRDRLRSTFMVQLARGLLHGDPHEGNFFIMPDGESIGLFDFGLTLEVGLMDAKGPLRLLASALLRDSDKISDAVLDLSTARDLDDGARASMSTEIKSFVSKLTDEIDGELQETRRRKGPLAPFKRRLAFATTILNRAMESVLDVGLAPLPGVMVAVRAIGMTAGNIERLAEFDSRKPSKTHTLSLMTGSWLRGAIAPLMGSKSTTEKQRRLQSSTQLDVPELLGAQPRGPPEDGEVGACRQQTHVS